MAKKKQKKEENYLDFVPVVSEKNTWSVEDGMVTIHMVHRGFYATIAQKVFHRPRVSHVDLEERGSFIFQQINGERTIGQLAELMRDKFGEDPDLYKRLVQYMRILHNNGFIEYKKKDK